ncbi:MAG: hypothetical protein JW873_04035 [Candidatus Saganbacteria bacterium]|nr:hypothetical protein [Candidatus Saganbacteria bacterium]
MLFFGASKSPAVRAGLPGTRNRVLRSYLLKPGIKPEVKETAYKNALDRLPTDPELAIDILAGNFPFESKIKIIEALFGSNDFRRLTATFEDIDRQPQPPRFFSLLAKRPERVAESVAVCWRQAIAEPGPEGALVDKTSKPAGKNLIAVVKSSYRSEIATFTHQVVGYEVGKARNLFRLFD